MNNSIYKISLINKQQINSDIKIIYDVIANGILNNDLLNLRLESNKIDYDIFLDFELDVFVPVYCNNEIFLYFKNKNKKDYFIKNKYYEFVLLDTIIENMSLNRDILLDCNIKLEKDLLLFKLKVVDEEIILEDIKNKKNQKLVKLNNSIIDNDIKLFDIYNIISDFYNNKIKKDFCFAIKEDSSDIERCIFIKRVLPEFSKNYKEINVYDCSKFSSLIDDSVYIANMYNPAETVNVVQNGGPRGVAGSVGFFNNGQTEIMHKEDDVDDPTSKEKYL